MTHEMVFGLPVEVVDAAMVLVIFGGLLGFVYLLWSRGRKSMRGSAGQFSDFERRDPLGEMDIGTEFGEDESASGESADH